MGKKELKTQNKKNNNMKNQTDKKVLLNRAKEFLSKNKKQVIIGSVAILLFVFIAIAAIIQSTNNKTGISPELAKAMTYDVVEEGDEAVEGTDNVKFDAFFLRDINQDGYAESIRGTSKQIGEEDTLYMELNVQTAGSLKDAKITINGENFYLQTSLPKDDELKNNYIGNNIEVIEFNPLSNGTQKMLTGIVRSGDYSYSSRKADAIGNNINNYSKVNSVTLTGTYVDDEGNETPITKTVEFNIDWYGTTEAGIRTTRQSKNIENAINEEEGIINLDFTVDTQEIDQELILSKNYVEGEIPELNGYAPTSVEYTGSNAVFNYNAETKTFTITREATVREDGTVTSSLSRSNSYGIRVTYPIEAYQTLGVETVTIKIPVKTYYEGYNNPSEEFTNPYKSNTASSTIIANYEKTVEQVYSTSFDVTVGKNIYYPTRRYIVSKEKPLRIYNGISEEEKDDTYTVLWRGYVGTNASLDGMIMKETKDGESQVSDQFIKTDATEESVDDVVSNVGIYFSGADTLLGEEGWIKIYDEDTDNLIVTFTAKDWNKYTSINPYKYEIPVKHIRVETSTLQENETSFYVYNIKEIDDEKITEKYPREEFDALQYIKSTLVGYISGEYIETDIHQANYEEPISVANIGLSKNTISTQSTEKNLKITIQTETNESYNEVKWQNGTFLVRLPEEIIDAQINNITVSNSNVTIENYELIEQDGIRFIKIVTKNDTPQSYGITIDVNISPDPRIATTTKQIELYATNENGENYHYNAQDIYDVDNDLNTEENVNHRTTSISMVSPNSLLTNQTATDYDDKGSEVISPQVADIKPVYAVVDQEQEEQTAKIGVQVKNNYASTISQIEILGKIPFKGNTYVISGGDLGSTFTTKMTNAGIEVPGELQQYVTLYYSENENPDRDIAKEENGWKIAEQVENWDNIKTFLIDLGDYVMPTGKEFVLNYTVKIPNGLEFNQTAFSHHGVYFCLDTDQGKYRTQTEPNKLGFRIAEKYDLELIKYQTGKDKLIPGATYSITEITTNEEGEEERKESKTAVTNSQGRFTITNLYAEKEYEIKEIKVPDDYELSGEVIRFIGHVDEEGILSIEKKEGTTRGDIEVEKEEGKNYKVTVNVEDEVKVTIKVIKKEQGTDTSIQGARFKLTGYGLSENGKSLTTNANGEITFNGLSVNQEYTLQEVKAEGYYLASPIKFKIVNNDGNYAVEKIEDEETTGEIANQTTTEEDSIPTISVTIEDEKIPTYELQIIKVKKTIDSTVSDDELIAQAETALADTEVEYLEGAKFKLYKGTEEIGEYTTDSEGKVTISGLYQYETEKDIDQTYTLKEVLAPEGYAKVKDITFKVEEKEGTLVLTIINEEGVEQEGENYTADGNTIKLTIEDSPSFRLIKKDAETQQVLAGVKFAIYNVDDGTEQPATNSKGEIIGTKETINGKEYYTVITDENGEITADLPEGLYKAVEVEAPDQYDIEGQTYYFGIGASREAPTIMGATQATSVGGNSNDQITSVASTSDGGYIAGGQFQSKSIQVGEYTLANNGSTTYTDGMIIKYDDEGEVEWVKSIGESRDESISSVTSTSDGGIIAVGYFCSSSIQVGEYTLTNNGSTTSSDYSDGMIIKYSSSGEVEWARSIGGSRDESISSVTPIRDGGIILGGYFQSRSIQVGEYTLTNNNSGNADGMIIKYSSNGEVEWVTSVGGNSNDQITSVASTSDGGYIAGGQFRSESIQVGEYTLMNNGSTTYTDGMIIKYRDSGEVEWARSIGGSDNDTINSITSSINGGYIAGGDFQSERIEVDGQTLINNGNTDGMIIKYSDRGEVEWARSIGGSQIDTINSIASTSDGGYIAVGDFWGSIQVGEYTLTNNGSSDGMIIKYSNNGDAESVRNIGGNSSDYIRSVFQTNDGGYIIGGYFQSRSIQVGDYILTNNGNVDGMILKIENIELNNPEVTKAEGIGGISREIISAVSKTNDGGYIIGGYFESRSIQVGEYTLTNNNSVNADGMIIKYSSNGEVEWVRSIGGNSSDYIRSVFQTNDGGYIIGGSFKSRSIQIGEHTLTNNGSSDGMMIKYSSEGEAEWARSIGGSNDDDISEVSKTNDGGYIVVGDFSSNSIQVGEYTLTNNGSTTYTDGMIIKYSGSGEVEWARSIGGSDFEQIVSATPTSDGGYVVGGRFKSSSIQVGEYTLTKSGSNYFDGMIIKYNSSGEVEWAKSIGESRDESISSVTSTSDGGIIAGGYFEGTIQVGEYTLTANGNVDGMVIKYDSEGKVEWAKSLGGSGSDQIVSATPTSDGGIAAVGDFLSGSIQVGEYTLTNNGSRDVIIIKYSSSGDVEWVKSVGGNDRDEVTSVTEAKDGSIIVGGYFASKNIEVDGKTLTNNGNTDGMILEIVNQVGVPEVQELTIENSRKEFKITTEVKEIDGVKGGTISGEEQIPYETVKYGETSTQEIKMTSEENYEIIGITVNGKEWPFEELSDGTYTMPQFTNMTEDKHVEVTYALKDNKLTINKVDSETQKPLAGATFQIEQIEVEEGDPYTTEVTTNSEGQGIVQIPFGKYQITEIKAPEGYELNEEPMVIDFTADGDNHEITIENKESAKVIVHHYLKNNDGEYTTEKVAEDELLEGKIGEKYTTSPKLDLMKYELEKDENGSYVIPEKATGIYESGTIEITYYYEEKEIPLTVHHYIEGTATAVPLKDGSEAEDVTDSGKEGTTYQTNEIEDSLLSDAYEISEIPENAEGTYTGEEVIVTYYYKLVERPVTIVKTGDGGESLEGVTFELIEKENPEEILGTYTTNQEGKITLTLPAGEYIARETEVPEDYQLPEETETEFAVTKQEETITVNIENTKKKGEVITHHYIEGTEENVPALEGGRVEDVKQTGNVGDRYATKQAENIANNYEYVSSTENTSGEIVEGTTEVIYYYKLKDPTIETSEIAKASNTEKLTNVNQIIDYTINYKTTIETYIGKATITIVDELPYEIDEEKSNIGEGTYNKENKTITWTEEIGDIDTFVNGAEKIDITKEISLVYKDIDVTQKNIRNKVTGTIKLETPEKEETVEDTKEIPTEYVVNIIVNKIWKDNETQAGRRPESIILVVKNGDQEITTKEITKDDIVEGTTNQWATTIEGLQKYDDNGEEIHYTVEEREKTEGDLKFYEAQENTVPVEDKQATIRNNFVKPDDTTTVTVNKVWNDDYDRNAKRPESIKLQVKNGDYVVKDQIITEANAVTNGDETNVNEWTYTFTDLPKYDENGQEIQYTVAEQEVNTNDLKFYTNDGITGDMTNGYTIENTFSVPDERIELTVNKEWSDNETQAQRRPDIVIINVKGEDGSVVATYELNTETETSHTFTDLKKYNDQGNEIEYTVEEVEKTEGDLKFYKPTVGSITNVENEENKKQVTITNTFTKPEETTEVTVTKVWNDSNDEAEKRPESIKLQLKNGNIVAKEQEVNESNAVNGDTNTWQYTFTEVEKYNNNGEEIRYTADEVEVNNNDLQFYTKTISGTNITNTFTQNTDKVEIQVNKIWEDNEIQAQRRPESVIIVLKANGEEIQRYELSEMSAETSYENTWIYTFKDLAKYDEQNNIINYTVEEIEKTAGDLKFYTSKVEGTTITNTFKRPTDTISIEVNKKWEDQENTYGKRPTQIKLEVKNGETVVKSAIVTKEDDWSATFTKLEKYDENGQEIQYTVDETEVLTNDLYHYEKTIGEVTNKVGETNVKQATITNTMTKIPSTVVVKYVDKYTGDEIADEKTKEGIIGDPFDVTEDVKDIEGYTLVEEPEEKTGTYTAEPQEKIYYYAKNTSVIVKYLEQDDTPENTADNKVLAKEKTMLGHEGERYVTSKEDIDGYTLVATTDNTTGTMQREEIVVIYYYAQNTKVTVKYLEKDDTPNDNSDNKVLAPEKTINGHVGETYTTEEQSIPNYTCIEKTTNYEGTMTKEPIEVIYYYAQNTKVVVKYLEKDDTPEDNIDNVVLAQEEILEGYAGQEYKTEEKTVTNYTLVETTENTEGTMTKEIIEVIYYYAQNTKATVQHIDRETGEILKQETQNGKVGDLFETHAEDFEGYVLVESPEEPNIIMDKTGEQIVKYYYAHMSAGVIEKHIDEITGELLYSEEHEGNEGDHYNIPSREFEGYDLVTEDKDGNSRLPENAEGEMTEDLIEVKYYYIKKASVIVKYLEEDDTPDDDTDNKVLAKEEIIEGHENDSYETEAKDIKDYNLVGTPENAKGIMTITQNSDGTYNTQITVIYYYKEKAGGVIENHIDITTNKKLATEEHSGSIGDEYDIPSRQFTGYDLVVQDKEGNNRLPENAKGTMTEEEIVVDYYYIKQAKVKVEYIDKHTGEKLDEEEINGHIGDEYNTEEKEFDGYDLVEKPSNSTGEMTEEEIVVKYYYERKAEVEVKYLEKGTEYEIAPSETIEGYVGDKYETEQKEISYYKFVEKTENDKGTMKTEKITVIYYYEKQTFNLKLDKWISKVNVDRISQMAQSIDNKEELYKVDIHRSKAETADITITYKIRVTNTGEIEGTVGELIEIIPAGYSYYQEDNKIHWEERNGSYVTDVLKDEVIKPGENKEVEIVLRWDKGEDNFGEKENLVILSKIENPAGYDDMEKEDNSSSASMILTIATGLDRNDRIIIIGVVQIVLAISIGLLVSYKKKEKKKRIR